MEESIETQISELGYSLSQPKKLAAAIQDLSDHYISRPEAVTPWSQKSTQAAYLSYYFPLNAMRAWAVVEEGHRVGFFEGLRSLLDYGSGLGSGSWSLSEIEHHQYIETSDEARRLHQKLAEFPEGKTWLPQLPARKPTQGLAVFSYSLTELPELPAWAYDFEALMLIEPSTRQDGRKLLQMREKLRERGFHIWAPCTHQEICPLLKESDTDWCHDRIFFKAPNWFMQIESQLPFKNQTLTMSYLLARKTPPPAQMGRARLTGDRLDEKGKSRQMVCRSSEREFLSWMHREGEPQLLYRGSLIDFPTVYEKKSNEIRVGQLIKEIE